MLIGASVRYAGITKWMKNDKCNKKSHKHLRDEKAWGKDWRGTIASQMDMRDSALLAALYYYMPEGTLQHGIVNTQKFIFEQQLYK